MNIEFSPEELNNLLVFVGRGHVKWNELGAAAMLDLKLRNALENGTKSAILADAQKNAAKPEAAEPAAEPSRGGR